jgi:uncharacterized cofD-like protein
MCDEGGSTGRLRKTFGVPAVGDIRDCIAALSDAEPTLKKLLYYRFAENSQKNELAGHNLGNLILVALADISGDFNKGIYETSKLFKLSGSVLPSTSADAHIWAETVDGQKIYGESKIDLGQYNGKREISQLHLTPDNAKGFLPAITAIKNADIITAGPGDLFTSIMPNLLIKDIVQAIKLSKAKKILIVNIANKPFETPNYSVSDYIRSIKKHCSDILFDNVLVNNNFSNQIPKKINYHYVKVDYDKISKLGDVNVIEADFVNSKYPIHHDPEKIAARILSMI